MATGAALFFETFFRELENRGIPAVILHGYEPLPEQMPSDVDFAVGRADLPKLLPIQREVAARLGWILVRVLRARIFALFTAFFDAQDPSQFIQLDACSHYAQRGCLLLRDTELLSGRRRYRSFNVPAPAAEFAYLLTNALTKAKPLEPYLPRMRSLSEADRAGANRFFKKLVGDPSGDLDEWFKRPAAEWDRVLRPRLLARTRFGAADLVREGARAVQRVLRPVGLHVVVLGPDGAGKSALISSLAWFPGFRRSNQFRFRLGLWGKNARATDTRPHAQPVQPAAFGVMKTLHHFAGCWLSYWLRVFPAKVRNELVVSDRSFEDPLVEPQPHHVSRGGTLARVLKKLLPKPDVTVVLGAESGPTNARKPELEGEELHRQREAWRRPAGETPGCIVVPAGESLELTAHTVRCKVIMFLAEREKQWGHA
jgi:hypothetical protein